MLSIGNESFALLSSEARDRGIKVQELIRAVIIPEWTRVNLTQRATTVESLMPNTNSNVLGGGELGTAAASIARVKTASGNGNGGRGSERYQSLYFRNPRR
ncbi:MAG TPA: hypothetical protein VE177_04975 [Candidatus Binatus sp.]|nr:hypothetical protein [Candidatus Binatus sp.]